METRPQCQLLDETVRSLARLPLSYDARTTVPNEDATDEGATAMRKVTPLIAFGLGFSPNKYLSLLVGLTVAQTSREKTDTAAAVEDETLWATTVGFGGNLDIITALTKVGSCSQRARRLMSCAPRSLLGTRARPARSLEPKTSVRTSAIGPEARVSPRSPSVPAWAPVA